MLITPVPFSAARLHLINAFADFGYISSMLLHQFCSVFASLGTFIMFVVNPIDCHRADLGSLQSLGGYKCTGNRESRVG